MSTRYPKDPGLSARMGVTIFLLGLLYVVFIGALLAVGVSYGVVIVIAGGLLFAQYFFSDKIALFSMHARVVSEQEAPELHAIVDRLCALADMPKPRVGIAQSDVPNAFATGRSPRAAVVCVTTGIMRRLSAEEFDAYVHAPMTEAERLAILESVAWFTKRYPTPAERLAAARHAYKQWAQGMPGRRESKR